MPTPLPPACTAQLVVIGGQPYVSDWAAQQQAVWNDALSRLMLAAVAAAAVVALHTVAVLLWHILPLLCGAYVPLPAWLVYPGALAGGLSGCLQPAAVRLCCCSTLWPSVLSCPAWHCPASHHSHHSSTAAAH